MSSTSRRLLWALQVLALAVIALHLAAPLSREEIAWGVWPATYLPLGWRWGLGLAAAALVLFGEHLWRAASPVVAPVLGRLRFGGPGWRLAVAALSAVPFYLFRIRHLRWGDARLLVQALSDPYRITYVWQAPLDVYLHARAWQLGNRLFGWPDPIPVYLIMSMLAGVAFVWVSLTLASWLGRDRTERMLLVGLLLTLGTMELFFGYIENYSIMTLGVLVTIWLALRALRGEVALAWPATALALTHAFHPSTIILAPTLLYLAVLLRRQADRRRHAVRSLLSITVPYIVVFTGVIALMTAGQHGLDALLGADFPGGGDRQWFVPLFAVTTGWQHYTMFSVGHLLDIVNEQLLIAPVVLVGTVLAAILAWSRLPRRDPAFRLLLLMTGCYLLLVFTWNADYGGQMDWDLFSAVALPATVLFAYLLPRALPERPALRAAGWALIAAQGFHTAAWIYQNTLPWPP